MGSNFPVRNGFIAQLVRASHRYRKVTGSNPVEVLNFSGFSTQLLNCVHNCEDNSFTREAIGVKKTNKKDSRENNTICHNISSRGKNLKQLLAQEWPVFNTQAANAKKHLQKASYHSIQKRKIT